jgi:hypothetical protein
LTILKRRNPQYGKPVKKNEIEIQNRMEGHSSRIEQTEDRISEFEDEMATNGKTEKLLV